MLDVERQYFDSHQEELLRQFPGRFVVIKGEQVQGSFETIDDAFEAAARAFGLSPVLIRRTDHQPRDVWVPALDLGILRADPTFSSSNSTEDNGR